jgi:hypothetical protein
VPQFHIPPNIRSSLGDELLIMVVKRVWEGWVKHRQRRMVRPPVKKKIPSPLFSNTPFHIFFPLKRPSPLLAFSTLSFLPSVAAISFSYVIVGRLLLILTH